MPDISGPAISVTDLTYRYPANSRPSVENIDLTIENGEFLAVIGSSGCGKSTLLRCLTGLIPQASEGEMHGEVEICGLDTRDYALSELATKANMVFQDPEIGFFCSTVEDEIAFGPANLGLNEDTIKQRVNFAVESVGIEHLRSRRVVDLSGGEKQRVAIASVLSMKPKILVLDEPTSDLDAVGACSTIEVLQSLRIKRNMTVIVSEHRLDDLSRYLTRVVVMQKGRIAADGSPEEIFNARRSLLHELGILPHDATREVREANAVGGETGKPRLHNPVISHTGCSGLCELKRELRSRDAVLHVSRLGFNYPNGPQVLHDVSFEIGRGEMVALLGANGTGKTTLAHLVAGLLKPSRGSILLNGTAKSNVNHRDGTGLLFQNPSRQLFCESAQREVEFGPRNRRLTDFASRAQEMLTFFGLEQYVHTDPHHLSEGEKQRLATASILAARPELLILDEPTTGQDWRHLRELMDLLQECVRAGMSVLLITHDVRLANQYATRVMIMKDGTITADGSVTEALSHDIQTRPVIMERSSIGY